MDFAKNLWNSMIHGTPEPDVSMRSAPILKSRPNSQQPKPNNKMQYITTEIRCQEKSKGGLCYEVILAQPSVITPPKQIAIQATRQLSVEEIDRKLKEAEERRLSLEAKKIADWSAKISRIEEASRKKDELNAEFMSQAKENLEAKMEHYEEKREALMSDMKEKLKNQFQEIEKTRTTLEQQKEQERKAIENKLKTAASIRDENIKKMLDRLKEHNTTKLAEVKITADVRENEKALEKKHIFENKLFVAEQNREKELQKKLENIRKHDRHIQMVRQNKAAFQQLDNNQPMIATE